MPTEILKDEIYHKYDTVVSMTLAKIHQFSKDTGVIRLFWFDRKNKEHLFFLRVALMARDIFNFPIVLQGISWFNLFYINRKLKKGFEKVTNKYPGETWGIAIPQMLDIIKREGRNNNIEDINFEDIYNAYYEGSLN